MADSGKPISELGLLHTLPGRLKLLVSDADNTNKPDFRQLDLGSPVSPLRPRPAISSSSSSSGSGSGSGGNGNGSHFLSTSRRSDSGELSADSSPTSSVGGSCSKKSTHFRSYSAGGTGGHPLIYSGGSSATSPTTNVLPTGNICPSGKILKTGMMANRSSKTDVLSFGTCNYGHGSIMRGGSATKTAVAGGGTETPFPNPRSSRRSSIDPEELKRKGNEEYKRGHFIEALSYYDRAIAISPENAAYHCNRGAALMSLKRLTDAVKECDEAIKLDSGYVRAHHRLGSLLISLGQVENARRHLCFPGSQPDPNELKRLQTVESHLSKCTTSRRVRDWARVLRECDAAIVSGADACPQLFACKAEALLKLSRLDDADLSLSSMRKFEASCSLSFSQQKFFGMAPQAYLLFVSAQIDMAIGRFENAVTTIEKSGQIDPRNVEIAVLLQNVRSVSRARACGNDFFKSERFKEACSAYGEGLRLDPSNPVLYCNRAACWFKLGQLERSLDDCNQALLIHPNYTKALLRRAAIYTKLDRWAESLRDYEVLKRELPNNNEIAESLFHAQVALKKSRGEEVYNMKFGGEVESITSLEQFKSAVASTGASVVLFKSSSEPRCKQISPFLDTLCTRYPSITFLKVDVEENQKIAKSENVGIVPTIKIYKKGNRAKEMVNPSQEALESSVKPYSS
ncbi:TPR repeat-containing thioredoxin TTL1 [Cynara cardunculus var. scolymus]|uniref:TPR repeat-containing thioredoxin TTL1 n=1 Tax=Cynara cardunculus var. scolymus TaxID=59895 RepID=UPI000D62A04C|nr:TPR repeat-containing thioredoxin TTL1 [Cynara cardunculus var. scolymus]